jgi:fatty acid desaturase
MSTAAYPDIFDELKAQVREAGFLKRVPVRGTVEMVAVLLSFAVVYSTLTLWNPILLGLFMTLLFTRAVFVAHDILHLQYFQNKKLSFRLSYPFSAIILSNSSSWWDYKHNVNHHHFCNTVTKDRDIMAFDGAFTPNNRGNKPFLKKYKRIIFWGAMFFMYPAFIAQSYSFALKHKNYGELFLMLLHWPVIWGLIFYLLPIGDALTVFITLYLTLSVWLSYGFITNHLGCEVFTVEEVEVMSWMELQMRTSRSLKGGLFVHWFYGGLNTQIEHHLFPKAPRFNLLKVQQMTRDFAKKHNLAYFETTPIEAYVQINRALDTY